MSMQTVFELQAGLCRVMGHPTRLEIVHILRDSPKRVSGIAQWMGLPQGTVSRHLAILRSNRIDVVQRQGQDVLHSIANPKIVGGYNLMRQVLLEQTTHRSELMQTLQVKHE
jgi:ArsR family transcriptional regulator